MKKIFKILLVGLGLGACEKKVDIALPDPGNKITIDARLASGQPASALVSRSVSPLSSENPDISDQFTVRLLEDGQLVDTLRYDNNPRGGGNYQSAYEPVSGKTYTVKATSPSLPDAQGSDRVPQPVEIKRWEYNAETQDLRVEFPVSNRGSVGYYALGVSLESTSATSYSSSPVRVSSLDPEVVFFSTQEVNNPGRPSGEQAIIKAQASQGQEFSVTLRLEPISAHSLDTSRVDSLYYAFTWEHWTEDYYRFNRREALSDLSGNGPFGEPVQPYFNVEGGYGIVGGLARSRDTLVLKP